jgi:acyl dehydratase
MSQPEHPDFPGHFLARKSLPALDAHANALSALRFFVLPEAYAMTLSPGTTSTKPYLFDAVGISAFAHGSGDLNPLHHDEAAASASRFKGVIASGAHMTAVLMGFGATLVSAEQESVGLEFSFKFERAIHAGTPTILSWTIVSAEPHAKLGGTLVTFEGAILGEDGKRYVSATGKAVVWDRWRA